MSENINGRTRQEIQEAVRAEGESGFFSLDFNKVQLGTKVNEIIASYVDLLKTDKFLAGSI